MLGYVNRGYQRDTARLQAQGDPPSQAPTFQSLLGVGVRTGTWGHLLSSSCSCTPALALASGKSVAPSQLHVLVAATASPKRPGSQPRGQGRGASVPLLCPLSLSQEVEAAPV